MTLTSPEEEDRKDARWPKPMRGVKDPDPEKKKEGTWVTPTAFWLAHNEPK